MVLKTSKYYKQKIKEFFQMMAVLIPFEVLFIYGLFHCC